MRSVSTWQILTGIFDRPRLRALACCARLRTSSTAPEAVWSKTWKGINGTSATIAPAPTGRNRFRSKAPADLKRSSVLWLVPFDGKPGLDPVFFAFGVDRNVPVAQLRQSLCCNVRVLAGDAGAVDDDLCILLRQHPRRKRLYLVVG